MMDERWLARGKLAASPLQSRATEEDTMATASVPMQDELTAERVAEVKAKLVETDGEPLESPWHRSSINLLIDCMLWHRHGRSDFFVGGNMFIYFSVDQTRGRKFRGPDFFFVKDVDGTRDRRYWWTFEEGGRLPDVILELLSPTTAQDDRTTKKDVYEQVFRTPEYFCYDPDTHLLQGWRLVKGRYEPIQPNELGWLWSEEAGLWIGTWEGTFQGMKTTWIRFYDANFQLVLTQAEYDHMRADQEKQRAEQEMERAEQEKQRAEQQQERADQEKQRAESLQDKVANLERLLAEKGLGPPHS
jgi:Uma2 family endonuclease